MNVSKINFIFGIIATILCTCGGFYLISYLFDLFAKNEQFDNYLEINILNLTSKNSTNNYNIFLNSEQYEHSENYVYDIFQQQVIDEVESTLKNSYKDKYIEIWHDKNMDTSYVEEVTRKYEKQMQKINMENNTEFDKKLQSLYLLHCFNKNKKYECEESIQNNDIDDKILVFNLAEDFNVLLKSCLILRASSAGFYHDHDVFLKKVKNK